MVGETCIVRRHVYSQIITCQYHISFDSGWVLPTDWLSCVIHQPTHLVPILREAIVTCYRCAIYDPCWSGRDPLELARVKARGSPSRVWGQFTSVRRWLIRISTGYEASTREEGLTEMSLVLRKVIVNFNADLLKSFDIYTLVKYQHWNCFLDLTTFVIQTNVNQKILFYFNNKNISTNNLENARVFY